MTLEGNVANVPRVAEIPPLPALPKRLADDAPIVNLESQILSLAVSLPAANI